MKTSLRKHAGVAALIVLASASGSHSQVLYSQSFDTDSTANWTVNTLGPGSDASFFFDYSSVGIPSAPNSTGGSTLGLRLRAHQFGSAAVFPSGVSVSPNGQSFVGDYELRFDMWLNFNGPAPAGGSGSTQITGAGIGTAGTSAQIAGGVIDSINFGASAEGGSAADYRAYAPGAQTSYLEASGVYAAGTQGTARNNSDAYYASFGGASAPAAQLLAYPQQTGTTAVGSQGWAWRDVRIVNSNSVVQWFIGGTLIASVDSGDNPGTLGGGNILFQQFDINTGVSTDSNSTNLLFGLFDNVRITAVPEPGTVALAVLGGAALFFILRRRK